MTQTAASQTHSSCECGCGQIPKSKTSKFMPGHDRRFMGVLAHAARIGDGTYHGEDPLVVGARVFSPAGLEKLRKEIERHAAPAEAEPAVEALIS